MDDKIPTNGLARNTNFQGQEVPSFPDNGDFIEANPAAFFDGPISVFANEDSEITVIPEGKRVAVETLIAAYKLANDGADPDDVTELDGIEDLVREITLPAGVCLPFRVCMVTAITGSALAAY